MIGLVYLVAFFVSILTVLFDVGYQTYLPSLVSRTLGVAGRSKSRPQRQRAAPFPSRF